MNSSSSSSNYSSSSSNSSNVTQAYITFTFNDLQYASLPAEWFFLLMGVVFCIISIFGNGYVSYRLVKIVRVSRAIQTPIYLSLTLSGLCTGVFCMPYMLYTLYVKRIMALQQSEPSEPTTYVTNYTASYYTPSYYNYTPYYSSSPITGPYFYNTEASNNTPCKEPMADVHLFDRVMFNVAGTIFNITSRLLVWLMLLLSVDRYIFICLPYRIHLVKKQHYVIWILLSCLAVSAMSFAPFIFYYPEVTLTDEQVLHCAAPLYQPYKPTYVNSYIFDNQLHVLLNTLKRSHLMALFVFTVVLFLIVPICLNVILSCKVLYEVSKMKKVGRTTTCTYPLTYTTAVSTTKEVSFEGPASKHRVPILHKLADTITQKFQGFQSKHQSSVIENKASFTMLVLSLFYIVTYFAWLLVWFSTIPMILNLNKKRVEEMIWIFLYHSNNMFAYNITNHYPQATFANAAFVPCLLAYSLHRGKS